MNAYEQKVEARRSRLEARAERLRKEGEGRITKAREMASIIPFGQPILVGHHSEKSDRAYRGKIHSNFAKGFETLNVADEVAAKAASVGTGGVSSDDPDAIAKLRDQLAELEALQAKMTAANKLVRKQDRLGLASMGYSEQQIEALLTPDFAGRIGHAAFQLTNNSASIRRIKQRVETLERNAARETKAEERADGIRIVENAEANRLQIFFPGKPADDVRSALKSAGFRWSPTEGAWQRQLNNAARYAAEHALKSASK
jgi:hypothetical protein